MGETHRPVHEYFCERDIPLADNGGGTDSQWKRYADILPHLERLEVNGIEREEAFLQQYSALPLALFKHPEFAKRHGQAIRRTTHFAFALVDKALTRRLADGRKTALEMHDGARLPGLGINNPYISIQLTPAHARNQASITAYRGLEKTTYYCGQKPGTSIFRYKGRKESFSFDEGDTILSQSWEPAEMLSFESELGQQEGAQRDDFEYVGYVPRHVVEVVARLRKVSGDVVAFLAGCLAYGEHERTGAYNHKYRAWMHLGAGVTESDAAAISRDWSEEFKPGHVFPRELSVYARDVRAVTEFVLLIDVLEHSSSGHVSSSDLTMFRTLRGMLLRVCNLSDKELIALEYRREADQAFALLLGQYATDQCFVYEDPSVDNIHTFYAGNSFSKDPNHPTLRCTLTTDFSKVLETSEADVANLHRDWDAFDPGAPPPEDDTQEAQQGLTAPELALVAISVYKTAPLPDLESTTSATPAPSYPALPYLEPSEYTTATLPDLEPLEFGKGVLASLDPALFKTAVFPSFEPIAPSTADTAPRPPAAPATARTARTASTASTASTTEPQAAGQPEPPRRKRGRPPGSKNKKRHRTE